MPRTLAIRRVARRPEGRGVTVTVTGDDGLQGSASVDPGGIASLDAGVARWLDRWAGTDALAFERRWRDDGAGRFASRADRAVWSALEFACANAAANALGLTVAQLFGGQSEPVARAMHLPDPALTIDAADFDDPQSLGLACRDTRALSLRFTLADAAGPQGLRRLLGIARVYGLEPVLVLEEALDQATGFDLARAFGIAVSGGIGPEHVTPPAIASTTGLSQAAPPRAVIRRIRLRRIRLPLANVYVSAMYLMDSVQRTIIEFESDGGLVGLGETLGADDVYRLVASMAKSWIGQSAFERRVIARRHYRILYDNRNGRNGWQALGGLDMAAADLMCRSLDLPLSRWLGSATSEEKLPVVCLLPTAMLDQVVPRAELRARLADTRNVDPVARHARHLWDHFGIRSFKYKSSGLGMDWDVAAVKALRDTLGPDANIRFDPNAAYGPSEAFAILRALESYAVTWYEDPTDGLDALARIRAQVSRPIATNMAAVQLDHLASAMRLGAIDVALGDTLHWGGVEGMRDLTAACEGIGLTLANHAFYETGIAAAANLQVALGLGLVRYPHDQTHDGIAADVVENDPLVIRSGMVRRPDGSGLGVRLDAKAVEALQIEETNIG